MLKMIEKCQRVREKICIIAFIALKNLFKPPYMDENEPFLVVCCRLRIQYIVIINSLPTASDGICWFNPPKDPLNKRQGHAFKKRLNLFQ